jgi:hypothetical protein
MTRNRADYTSTDLATFARDVAADHGRALLGYAMDDGDAPDWYVYVEGDGVYGCLVLCCPAQGPGWQDHGDAFDCSWEVQDAGGTWLDQGTLDA